MKYGFIFFGGDARQAAEYAYEAEKAGWDGFFVPDAPYGFDPWVMLTAATMRTERIKLGTMLTPVSRRRPWKLASELMTLDLLSGGRVILGVGLGAVDTGFAEFGEETDRKVRAELVEETLDIVKKLFENKPFSYKGKHNQLKPMKFLPDLPKGYKPSVTIWMVGAWKREKSMARAIQYDGLLPNVIGDKGASGAYPPETVREMRAYIDQHRTLTTPYDIVVESTTPGDDPKKAADKVRPFAEAGATWYLEAMWDVKNNSLAGLLKRIQQGPPRVE
jgi:alkanesulfonate monooxygenase SsuD/methylene tetrahydromethanopterin reductase-like flavin-dependent oxidoreductase (luciferase family)